MVRPRGGKASLLGEFWFCLWGLSKLGGRDRGKWRLGKCLEGCRGAGYGMGGRRGADVFPEVVVWVRVVTCADLCRGVWNCGKWGCGIVACWRVGERETGGKGGRV